MLLLVFLMVEQTNRVSPALAIRDVAARLVPDENTVYHIASPSKTFTAATTALLVADRELSTLLDFLSHRTGLASKDALWQQDGHELLLSENDTIPRVPYLEVIHPLRRRWTYKNWGYEILPTSSPMCLVFRGASSLWWRKFMTSRILEPLGMRGTTSALRPLGEHWARGFMPGPDGKLTDVGSPVIAEGTVQQGANGVKSTVRNLITYYKAVLAAWRLETGTVSLNGEPTSPLSEVKELLTPHIPLGPNSDSQWYGAG
ncbi:beta-lactamase/transpeptidase-like protein [Triangularia verruculosa]|uniref:Beta-lactamase/transpeptidase-like protein n=1 Tax=Triangularia verruculosa TaxID=2587418 RepID=A0AAN7AWI9_9PEZI|nr:beta-lactamase/transpeptidase-like protein [Triangularia verruculosa]